MKSEKKQDLFDDLEAVGRRVDNIERETASAKKSWRLFLFVKVFANIQKRQMEHQLKLKDCLSSKREKTLQEHHFQKQIFAHHKQISWF